MCYTALAVAAAAIIAVAAAAVVVLRPSQSLENLGLTGSAHCLLLDWHGWCVWLLLRQWSHSSCFSDQQRFNSAGLDVNRCQVSEMIPHKQATRRHAVVVYFDLRSVETTR